MEKTLELNPNAVVAFLKKKPVDFTREDLIKFIKENNIRMIDFMYPAEDGRVKTLNFVINNLSTSPTALTRTAAPLPAHHTRHLCVPQRSSANLPE